MFQIQKIAYEACQGLPHQCYDHSLFYTPYTFKNVQAK